MNPENDKEMEKEDTHFEEDDHNIDPNLEDDLMDDALITHISGVDGEPVQHLTNQITHPACSVAYEKNKSKHIISDMPNNKSEPNYNTSTNYIDPENRPFIKGDLVFDKSVFKAGINRDLGYESKLILSQVPEKRSKEQIEDVRQELIVMGIKSFLDYPAWMQHNIIKIARFDVVTQYTVIISQGNPANKCYILLKGTVEVYTFNKANRSKNIVVLKRGDMFGETEMVNRLNWNATYTSKGNVELLRIDRDEMVTILTYHPLMNEPFDHIKFLQRCDFTNSWPLDRLTDKPGCCIPYFFKRNSLIVEDSYNTDFLVVIRSGKCRVMRKLYRNVRPKPAKSKSVKDYGKKFNQKSFSLSRKEVQADSVHVDTLKQILRTHSDDETQTTLFKASNNPQYGMSCKRDTYYEYCFEIGEPENSKSQASSLDEKLENTSRNRENHPSQGIVKGNEELKTPVYIELETLKAKDVFGLETLGFDKHYDKTNSKGLFLVSSEDHRGVSAVFLSKTVFNAYASEKVVCNVQRLMKVYPDSKTIFDEIEKQKLSGNNSGTCECFIGTPQNSRYAPWKY